MPWHALALGVDIEPGMSAGTRLEGHEIVIWRDEAGAIHVWDDRCPHRGMKMSFGFVRGDHIACLYHGWRYDRSGRCRFIPAHPDLDVPDTIRIANHPAIERAGFIFAAFNAGSNTPPVPPDRAVTPVRSVLVDRPLAIVEEGLERHNGRRLPDGLLLVGRPQGDLLIALQPVEDRKTTLHCVLLGAHEATPIEARLAAAGFCEGVRDALEIMPNGAG